MALHRDFLMRMIEKLAAAFFQIVAGKVTDAPEQVLIDIEDLLAEALGTSRDFALGLGPEAIDNVEPGLAAELARLLLLHATIASQLGQVDRARRARTMGFRAIERAFDRPTTQFAQLAAAQLREHVDAILADITPDRAAAAFMLAHETAVAAHEWGEAEDWLFFALDAASTAQRISIGRTFYARLLALGADDLEAGGLTREEVTQGVAELDRYE